MSDRPATPSFVIALDGPAASGKGTLARRIAAHYGFAHLDTGMLYRGVAYRLLQAKLDPANAEAAAAAARVFSLDGIEEASIRTRAVGAAASVVAANAAVRAALLDFQRAFASSPPGGAPGAVLDGRDIGTTICPDAPLKFFVTADDPVRARRRWLEQREANPDLVLEDVARDLAERDARDAARDDAPMTAAEDAELLDTTDLTIDAAFAAARRMIDRALARRSAETG
ncbi:MAG: (d)CMP kinase [Pseudomonadota bacterium]